MIYRMVAFPMTLSDLKEFVLLFCFVF